MDTEILKVELTKLGISLLLGSILGFEREYNNKPAGFRTIALICIGATTFTLMSIHISSSSPDRIAANIVTGIGFIGAGVIFKSGSNVYGLTTSATIWVAAAIGMAVGAGEYIFAATVTALSLTILSLFEYLQFTIDAIHKRRLYFITFEGHTYDTQIEVQLAKFHLKYKKLKEKRTKNETTCEFEVFGKQKNLDIFNEFLLDNEHISAFEY
jgi:putative Mg2+ transporter-C (MgtC) family protein